MSLTIAVTGLGVVAGIMGTLLVVLGLGIEKNKKRARNYLIWSVIFLGSMFGMIEYVFFLEGYNLFNMIFFRFNFPLISYFTIWFLFIVWMFEKRKERKLWIIFLIALIAITVASLICFNCIRF